MSFRNKPRHYDWAISASRRSHTAIASPLASLRSKTVGLLDSITGGAADEQEQIDARRRADEIKAFTCRGCGIPYAGAEALSAVSRGDVVPCTVGMSHGMPYKYTPMEGGVDIFCDSSLCVPMTPWRLTLSSLHASTCLSTYNYFQRFTQQDHTKTDGKAFQRTPTRTRSVPLIQSTELQGLVQTASPTRAHDPSAGATSPASPTSADSAQRRSVLLSGKEFHDQPLSPTSPVSPPSSSAPFFEPHHQDSRAAAAGKASAAKYAPLGSPTGSAPRGDAPTRGQSHFATAESTSRSARPRGGSESASAVMFASRTKDTVPLRQSNVFGEDEDDVQKASGATPASGSPKRSPFSRYRALPESAKDRGATSAKSASSQSPSNSPTMPTRGFSESNANKRPQALRSLSSWRGFGNKNAKEAAAAPDASSVVENDAPLDAKGLEILHDKSPFEDDDMMLISTAASGSKPEMERQTSSSSGSRRPPPPPIPSRGLPTTRPAPPRPPPYPKRQSTNPFLRDDAMAQLQLSDANEAGPVAGVETDTEQPFALARSREMSESSEVYVPKSPSNPFARPQRGTPIGSQ